MIEHRLQLMAVVGLEFDVVLQGWPRLKRMPIVLFVLVLICRISGHCVVDMLVVEIFF